jgi:hypothetical protein
MFIAAGLMLLLGWWLLPVKLGTYFVAEDFSAIREQFHFWIWMYRVYIFGLITTVLAYFALMALVAESPARVLVWPGAAVASAGMIVSALGAAFYYHHGAWGSIQLTNQSTSAAQAFVDALRVDTEYVTCLVRFGRVFSGLGLVVAAWGLWRWRILPIWSVAGAALIGVAAMALTMSLPDHLSYYSPVFHLLVLWQLATGFAIYRGGLNLTALVPAKP